MNGLFSTEGKLYRGTSLLADLIVLNLLFLLTSLPIFTIGASLAALSDVTIKMARKEDPKTARVYLASFKSNFRQATLSWLLILAVAALLTVNFSISRSAEELTLLRIPLIVLAVLLAGVSIYVFPMIAVFSNPYWKTFRISAVLALGYLPQTIIILIVSALPFLLILGWTKALIGLFLGIVILFALAARINAQLIWRIFKKWVPEEER